VVQTQATIVASMPPPIPVQMPGANWPVSQEASAIPVSTDGSGMADAAVGQATPNAQYLGNRLVYDKELEASFDPLGNTRLLSQYMMHAVVDYLVYWVGWWVSLVVLGIFSLVAQSTLPLVLWGIGALVFGLAFFVLWLFVPVPVQLSEWKFFVDGKGSVAPMAFDHIAWALQQRQTPLEMVQVRRLSLAGGESRDYLEIRRGLFTGMISCFAYGRDLYLGWTFWFKLSPGGYLLMWVARLWQVLTRHGNDMYVRLRYDYARAMREAMHSAAREGVDAAVGRARPQGQGLGASLQVQVADVSVQ
jgi:hypothetical protein